MKNLILVLIIIIFGTTTKAQPIPVTDIGSQTQGIKNGILQKISNGIQVAIRGYSALQSNIQKGTLTKVTESTKLINESLDVINSSLDVADAFNNTQMTKDFFIEQGTILKDIAIVSKDYFSVGSQILSFQSRRSIRNSLDDASILANKSLIVASNAFIKKQINMTERLAFIKEAQSYLNEALSKIKIAISIIAEKKEDIRKIDEKVKLYNAIF